MFSFPFSLCHCAFSSSSNSMFWLLAAQCSTPCFMVNWLKTRMKSIFQMWNQQLSWQCWSKDSSQFKLWNIMSFLTSLFLMIPSLNKSFHLCTSTYETASCLSPTHLRQNCSALILLYNWSEMSFSCISETHSVAVYFHHVIHFHFMLNQFILFSSSIIFIYVWVLFSASLQASCSRWKTRVLEEYYFVVQFD